MVIEKTIHNCMPPEAYMRIWESISKNNTGPRYASTVFVKKNIDREWQKTNVPPDLAKQRGIIDK